MPATRTPRDTEQFSVTLPCQACDLIEQLRMTGLYGDTRGAVTRQLVLARLEDLIGRGILKLPVNT